MLTSLIRMGDSFGIRIPVAMLEQTGLKDAVELLADKGRLIIQPERTVVPSWDEALASLAERFDDPASLGEVPDLCPRSV